VEQLVWSFDSGVSTWSRRTRVLLPWFVDGALNRTELELVTETCITSSPDRVRYGSSHPRGGGVG
jgi:hypothetical protein